MSNIESHVTSLETSKKLKELGVKQESLFYWCWITSEGIDSSETFIHFNPDKNDERIICSAFLSSELGEILPEDIENNHTYFILHVMKLSLIPKGFLNPVPCWEYKYHSPTTKDFHFETIPSYSIDIFSPNEAEARGKLLIYLLEEGLLKL